MKTPYCVKLCKKCNSILVANPINFNRKKNGKYGLHSECKKCSRERDKKWRMDNAKYNKERKQKWYSENINHVKEYDKQKYHENREEILARTKKYREDNPEKVFNGHHRRKVLEEVQGNGITKEQWKEMMEFFNWKCAYSGVKLDKNNRTIDHILALNKGGAE